MQLDVASKCGGKRLNGESPQTSPRHPLFTVVTVVFNGVESLESTVHSVLNQRYSNLEYIIIDGGSTDGTLEIIRKYEQSIDYWVSEPDQGVYDAFNKACRLIAGEWTIFLGAGDMLYETETLALISETVQRVAVETEIVYGKVSVSNGTNTSSEISNRPWSQTRDEWQGGRPTLPHHQGIFHRKQLLSTQSPFDISYRIAADSKLFYASVKNAEPVFADIIVARSPLGGLSTEPKYYLANLHEINKVNNEFGFANYSHQLWFFLKSVSKYALYRVGGEKVAKYSVDAYRQLTGRKAKWVL
jgi:glycosyltransferase involved in cell wall biosynthesis